MSAIIVTTIDDDEEYVGYDWEDMEDMEARGGVGCVHSRIAIDDRLNERYRIVYKLGYGTWSCVWLAIDEETRKYVAIKVGIAQSDGSEGEVLAEISQSLANSNVSNDKKLLVPTLLDRFEISGPKGTHPCLVILPAQCNLWIAACTSRRQWRIVSARCCTISCRATRHSRVDRPRERLCPWRSSSQQPLVAAALIP